MSLIKELLPQGFSLGSRGKRGFTLMELLIVIAIIGVFAVIGIPIFRKQLELAREATDAANIRSQYAEVMTGIMFESNLTNKDGSDYGKIRLMQTEPDWQNTELVNNLNSVAQNVYGIPVSGGYAWIEYDQNENKIELHYEEGSGQSGGSGDQITTGQGGLIGNGTTTNWEDLTDPVSGILILSEVYKETQTILGVKEGKTLSGELVIREGITDIHNGALQNQTGLTKIVFPDSMKTISNYAFSGTGITELRIPASVRTISKYAFSNTSSLSKVEWYYNSNQKYEGPIFSGDKNNNIQFTFHGTQAEWDIVKQKLGLDEGTYTVTIVN